MINFRFGIFLCFWFVIIFFYSAQSQIIQFPLSPSHQLNTKNLLQGKSKNNFKVVTTLSLPFFDDFSTSVGVPNPSLWINGGTFASNHSAINPPSKGVVQFDGSNYFGIPYNIKNQLAQGPTDTLTSQYIDLSSYIPKDSIALVFYFQPGGLGEQPDGGEGDSLFVDFYRSADSTWLKAWAVGGTAIKDFAKIVVPVNDLNFFNAKFKFRFRAYGRQSGAYDSWQLDYVYFNKNNDKHKYFRDLATTSQPTNFLKRYSAMPINQFQAGRANEIADSVITYLKNNNDTAGNFNIYSYNYKLSNFANASVYDNQNFNSIYIGKSEKQKVAVKSNASAIPSGNNPIILKTSFSFTTGDNSTYIPGVDFTVNDTISSLTVLDNYFAYDDGSAEYAGGINQKLGRVAIKFHANEPDTLTAIQFYFPQIGRSLVGQSFIMLVLKKLDNNPASILYQSSVNIDSVNFNKFATFEFDKTKLVIVSDTFYVGWQQIATSDQLNIGIDKNNPLSEKYIFSNIGGGSAPWVQSDDIDGAFMVRPVFGSLGVVSGTEEDEEAKNFKIFPNPNPGKLFWEGLQINDVAVFDMMGNKIFEEKIINGKNYIDLSSKSSGVYLFHFNTGKRNFVKKIVLVH